MDTLVVDAEMLTFESELCKQRADSTSVSHCFRQSLKPDAEQADLAEAEKSSAAVATAQSRFVVTHRQGRTIQKMRTIEVPQVQYWCDSRVATPRTNHPESTERRWRFPQIQYLDRLADLAENLGLTQSSSKIELARNTKPFPQGSPALHSARRVPGCAGMKELISSWRPWAHAAWTLRAYELRTPSQLATWSNYSPFILWYALGGTSSSPYRRAWFCFLNGQLQHHNFGPREDEHCVRWKHWTFRQRDRLGWPKGLNAGKSTTARV